MKVIPDKLKVPSVVSFKFTKTPKIQTNTLPKNVWIHASWDKNERREVLRVIAETLTRDPIHKKGYADERSSPSPLQRSSAPPAPPPAAQQ